VNQAHKGGHPYPCASAQSTTAALNNEQFPEQRRVAAAVRHLKGDGVGSVNEVTFARDAKLHRLVNGNPLSPISVDHRAGVLHGSNSCRWLTHFHSAGAPVVRTNHFFALAVHNLGSDPKTRKKIAKNARNFAGWRMYVC
jgi:hypothetical protein